MAWRRFRVKLENGADLLLEAGPGQHVLLETLVPTGDGTTLGGGPGQLTLGLPTEYRTGDVSQPPVFADSREAAAGLPIEYRTGPGPGASTVLSGEITDTGPVQIQLVSAAGMTVMTGGQVLHQRAGEYTITKLS